MVYFMTALSPYSDVVYPKFLDDPRKEPFYDVKLVADPDTLELNVIEREFIGKGRGGMGMGYRVEPDLVPRKILWAGGRKKIPEAILRGFLAVSERFRDLVEQFEPNVHQLFPVDIYKTKSGEVVARYYWLNVCNRIDSVDKENSNVFWQPNYIGERGIWRYPDVGERKLVFSRPKIGNRHLWYDPFLMKGINCSSAFGDAGRAADFLGLSLTAYDEV
ncbi:hypothetical protein U1839_08180 [Sphingomonas sp. RT2P30]|uniref:imm11 family protein n=1 Tax=Parasphingomonas halimpatiens TaxID=3096162 RepID=UPI002FCA6549